MSTQMRKVLWKRLRQERPCRYCAEDHETGWCPKHNTRNNEGPRVACLPVTVQWLYERLTTPRSNLEQDHSRHHKEVLTPVSVRDEQGKHLFTGVIVARTTRFLRVWDPSPGSQSFRDSAEWFPIAWCTPVAHRATK